MSFHMIFEVSLAQITFAADLASVFSEALLSISFIVQQLHVPLVQNSPSELHVTNAATVDLFHMRFNVTRPCR